VLERKARQQLVVARCTDPVNDVVARMKDADVSQVPVLGEHDQLLGMVSEVGLLNYLLQQSSSEASKVTIEDAGIIDTNVSTLAPETPIEAVMSVFSTNPVALVTERIANSEDRKVVGIITKIDLLDFLATR